jgi:hypothetical protein
MQQMTCGVDTDAMIGSVAVMDTREIAAIRFWFVHLVVATV